MTARDLGKAARAMVLAIGAAAILCPAGCKSSEGSAKGKTTTPTKGKGGSAGPSRCNAQGKRVVKLDLNQDKQPDVWKIYKSKVEQGAKVDVLTCKERDLNFDGRKDIWYYYDADGNIQKEEMDLDFDGSTDLVTIRRAGKVVRQEMDTNHDGKPDVWKQYEEEVLTRIDRDTNYNGKVDYWEYYEGGQLDRIGFDLDGDGRVDRWERSNRPAQGG